MAPTPSASRTLPSWRFWLPLVCQAALILAIPAQSLHTQLTGRTVILKTAPVDPYDLLRGYSVTLSYDISRVDTLRQLPGWSEFERQRSANSEWPATRFFYLVLEAPGVASTNPPSPWRAVRISGDRPTNLVENQVILRGQIGNNTVPDGLELQGRTSNNTVQYGLERYYIPEDQRDAINQNINTAQANQATQPIVVEVKVDAQGNAVPLSFWVTLGKASAKQTYHYQF
ncbi:MULTISPECIES: GDYXXLXY domain-containing protein [Trichocoleus]|uniref:GDYXXLXY domain-containing protein n=1 Tax=Trichocoleus desertorum GB2-A4 TaxID=2933944 RepID=A0ABV0JGH8_9CYAN|nr:GDYXXLXY domain-containing protein [Trichocoleus sp. FACHB-46]MBD1862742.1 GDYXXLXY domain-containing protein [Trichocoleus sp. FACHB-46]